MSSTIPQAKPITTTLHYLKRGSEKPTRYIDEPPPGVAAWNGIDDPREIRIEDARGRESELTIDTNGFELVHAPSLVKDFYAADEVKAVYYPEVEQLLRNRLGAYRVFIFDHTVRNAARSGAREPSRRVHNDHTVNSAPRRVRDHLGEDAPALLQGRFGIVNVWRPIRGPVADSPLALCDARSFTDDDLIASDLVYPHVRGETSSVAYRPEHRWYYFSDMTPDEVVLIRVHDSADDGRARLSFHTSFDNPLAPGAPPRESIEVRCLVFFPPTS
ncbi:CmcJ/NvfI family oxidoreductase [Vineibacter terrae]|uniref:CmcJ/NvfI family oxidoreductase n=1 Tax=Vineibacter terrae TaxID=2586908 RepID=UPI002E2EE75F|nr:CmcJ/NvfI family oxidoreductase [Vineibacter terrae]HEX2888319.1 CmcJ/NvfI family oxidoreductase [Vineibacter terrae]